MSVLLQLRSTLEAADPRELLLIGHDERRRLADTLRTWAWAVDQADAVARAEAMLPAALDRIAAKRLSRRPATQTHCRRGHPLTGHNVYFRNGSTYPYCRECDISRKRADRRRKRVLTPQQGATP